MTGKDENKPVYSQVKIGKNIYFRKRVTDADGKQVALYANTEEELAEKIARAKVMIEEAKFRKFNPTVAEYAEKWLVMHSAHIQPSTLRGYTQVVRKYIIGPLGDMYMSEVTADDIKLAMVPVSKKSAATYSSVNMLIKSIFYSAQYSNLITDNPARKLKASGGVPQQEKEPLTDDQAVRLLDAVRGQPPYAFVMLGLYAGLRREEILALKWDCVFLDASTPYISVRRAWHTENNRTVINSVLKTKSARRDIPIPKVLVDCLREEKEKSISDFVVADSDGQPFSNSRYSGLWNYISIRSTKERTVVRRVNGQVIKEKFKPELGQRCTNQKDIICCIDFQVTPHLLRHTYITNLIHAGVDPKTVQYLAGHKNSKVTMDIYAKVKYNKPEQLFSVVNAALDKPRRVEKAI